MRVDGPISNLNYFNNYLENATYFIVKVLDPFFNKGGNFKNMLLNDAHPSLVLGKDYKKLINSKDNIEEILKRSYLGHFQLGSKYSASDLSWIGKIRQINIEFPIRPFDIEKTYAPKDIYEKLMKHKLSISDRNKKYIQRIDGISEEMLPHNFIGDPDYPNWIIHSYPDSKFIDHYLTKMEERYSEIKVKIESGKSGGDPLIMDIANLYHIGINAHIFVSINNSILMGIVNYLLLRSNMHPIPHGYIDYVALVTDSDEFRHYFLEYYKLNPQIGSTQSK